MEEPGGLQSMGSLRVRHTERTALGFHTQFLNCVHVVSIEVEHKRTPGVSGVSGIK